MFLKIFYMHIIIIIHGRKQGTWKLKEKQNKKKEDMVIDKLCTLAKKHVN